MYSIEMLGPNGEWQTVYDPSQMNVYPVIGPKYEFELNEAGSLTFSLILGHPLYDELVPLAAFVRALDGDEEIFYGRVIQRSEPTLTGQVSITCEGALSFLMDSEIAPFGRDRRGNPISQTMTAQAFFESCVTQHNAEVDDPRRTFIIGTVNATGSSKSAEYTISSYTQTKNAIESNLLNTYGGFIRVRPDGNGGHYLDWIQEYETVDPQEIMIGINLEDQTNESDGSSVFTVIRPVGADGLTLQEGTLDLFPQEDIERYGRIVKTIEFKTADTDTKLRNLANEYLQSAKKDLFNSATIQLVDMHYLDGEIPKIRGGDRFTGIEGYEGEELVAASLEQDFENPQNDTVTLKNRRSIDPDLNPEGGQTAKSRSRGGGGGGGGGGMFLKYIIESEDNVEVIANTVYMHGKTLTQHYEEIVQNANYYEAISSRVGSVEDLVAPYSGRFNDIEYNINEIWGTGVIQNSNFISTLSGKFEIFEDAVTHKTTVHLKDGAEIAVDDSSGGTITVGNRIEQLAADVGESKAIIDSFEGSALWTQKDQIVGVAGEYDIEYIDVEEPPGSGIHVTKKVLVVKSGGGLRVREDAVEYGIFHEGNLTSGLLVETINGEQHLKLSADVVDLSAINARITMTKDQIMSMVEDELDQFYTQIIQEAGSVVIRTGESTQTFNQMTEPQGTQDNPLVDGDVWFQGKEVFSWGDASNKTWLETAGETWNDLKATQVWRYNGITNVWDRVIDARAFMQDTQFEITKERMRLMAGRVDVIDKQAHAHYAELKVEADNIHSQVYDYYNETESHITQTASEIRSELTNRANGLSSQIVQTAGEIRSEVNDSVSGLSSRITQTANQVSIVVDGNGRIKNAEIVAAINNGSSSIRISADKVDLDGYVTASMMQSAFQDIGQAAIGQLTIKNYCTFLGYNAKWMPTISVVTGISVSRTQKQFVLADGSIWAYYVVTGVSPTRTSITYLGR